MCKSVRQHEYFGESDMVEGIHNTSRLINDCRTRGVVKFPKLVRAIECLAGHGSISQLDILCEDILNAVMDNPASVEAVWHPLGFMYIELLQKYGTSVRFHIWSAKFPQRTSLGWLIHKHSWGLSSYLMLGSLKNHVYEIASSADPPSSRIYRVGYQGLTNHLVATGNLVSHNLAVTQKVSKGSIYRLAPGIFHRTEVARNSDVATFVLAEDAAGQRNEVLGETDGARLYTMTRPRCSHEEIRQAAGIILKDRERMPRSPNRSEPTHADD